MHNWVTLCYTWNYHSIVHQLYSNIKQKSFLKEIIDKLDVIKIKSSALQKTLSRE